MPLRLRCAALLFDSDGVLVDSHSVIDRVLRAWSARHGLDTDRVIELSWGRRDIELVGLAAPHLDAEAEARWIEERELADVEGVRALPGARELLERLPGGRWAVVTSGSGELVRRRLDAAGLPEPEVLISADDVREGKPSPEGYLKAARALGADPADCLVFEDAPSGVAAGTAAGARVIALLTTAAHGELPADAWIDDLRSVAPTATDSGEPDELIALDIRAELRKKPRNG